MKINKSHKFLLAVLVLAVVLVFATRYIKTENTGSNLQEFNKTEFNRLMQAGSDAYNQQEYIESLDYYKQALDLEELDVIYARMYLIHMSTMDYDDAEYVLSKARELHPSFRQYWVWTIEMNRDVHNASYLELYDIYTEAFNKVEITGRVSLVTFFARVSEEMGENKKAIELWEKAKEFRPNKTELYQGEIDRLEQK